MQSTNRETDVPSQGSLKDLKLTVSLVNEFFAEKLDAVRLYSRGNTLAETGSTKSECHEDGTTDHDD